VCGWQIELCHPCYTWAISSGVLANLELGECSEVFFPSPPFPYLPSVPLTSLLLPSPFPCPFSSCKLPSGDWAELRRKLNLVHFSFKIRHLVATILTTFPRIIFVQLKRYQGQFGTTHDIIWGNGIPSPKYLGSPHSPTTPLAISECFRDKV